MVPLSRAAVSLKGRPTYYSESNQSHKERNVRFVFRSQGHSIAFSSRAELKLRLWKLYHCKSLLLIEVHQTNFGVRLANSVRCVLVFPIIGPCTISFANQWKWVCRGKETSCEQRTTVFPASKRKAPGDGDLNCAPGPCRCAFTQTRARRLRSTLIFTVNKFLCINGKPGSFPQPGPALLSEETF
jgi:hypothetical protein